MKQQFLTAATALCLTIPSVIQAQFHAGSSFVVKANTPAVIDSVTLQPSADLNLSGNELTISNIPVVNTTPPGSSIARVAQFSAPFSYQGAIGLYYDNTELYGNTAAQLNLVYHTGQSGYSTTNLFTTSNNNNHVTATTGIQTITISKLTATNMGTVLPLQLLSFEAYKKDNSTLLKWETANEKNIHHFEAEKSTDTKQFVFLAQQEAGKNVYMTSDHQPTTGWNYYRLKIVENDRSHTYSQMAAVYFDGSSASFSLFPNPVTQTLNIQITSAADKDVSYAVSSIDGKLVKQGMMEIAKGSNHFTIDFSSLPAGTYLFRTDEGFATKVVRE